MRELIQLAVDAGRKRQRPETGYIHDGVLIPILDNFLFALALMRLRTGDSIREGRDLLERLLHFQAEDGNFPIYLHDYPHCKDRYFAAQLVPIMHYMARDFGSVLSDRLQNAQEKLPKMNPTQLVDKIVATQMIKPLHENKELWDYLKQNWNGELACFAGSHLGIFYDEFEPQVTLLDLFMGYLTGNFSKRALKPQPVHLKAALIQEETVKMTETTQIQENFSSNIPPEHLWKGFAPYCLVWGSPERVHNLILQDGNITQYEKIQEGFVLTLGEPIEDDSRQKQRDIVFFCDRQPATIFVNGQKANTFGLADEVVLSMPNKELRFKFELKEGEGEFMGHITPGNRPGQLSSNAFEAYDWLVFLRTIRRSKPCVIQVSLD